MTCATIKTFCILDNILLQFVAYTELEAGQIVEATVSGYNDSGASLAVSQMMSGHVPSLHLTNNPVKHPERKHAVGSQVTARVLKVNPKRNHLLLTLKSRLVNAKEDILTDYTQDAENMVTIGYVIKILPSGLLIGMFNDVKGFVPKSEVGVQSPEGLGALFQEGQVVRCRVLKMYPEKKNITLSLYVDSPKPIKKAPKLIDNVEMRSRVKCVVDEVESDVIKVTILPQNTKAIIPLHHLSDDTTKCKLLRELIKEKDEITNAVVFSKSFHSITLTLKPSVSFWLDHGNPEAVRNPDLMPKESYPAVVCDIKSYGLFVMIPSGNTGNRALVHIKNLVIPGQQTETKDMEICIGQSLYVSFKDKDDKGRPILTTSLKQNVRNATQSSLQLLYSYLKSEQMVTRGLLKCGGQGQVSRFGVGDKVVALVTEVTPQEVHVKIKNSGLTGVVPSGYHCGKDTLKIGQKVKACVLHCNQEEKSLELTLKPNLMVNIHLNKTETLKIGMKVKCEVVLAKNSFTMVIMKSEYKGTVAYLPTAIHMNMFSGGCVSNVGKKCWVVVKHVEGPLVLGMLKCHDKRQDLNLISILPQITFNPSAEGETDSELKEGLTDNEENSEIIEQSISKDMEHSETVPTQPVDSTISQTREETQHITKKRELESKETKKSKKLKTKKVDYPEQAQEDDSPTHQMSEVSGKIHYRFTIILSCS